MIAATSTAAGVRSTGGAGNSMVGAAATGLGFGETERVDFAATGTGAGDGATGFTTSTGAGMRASDCASNRRAAARVRV